MSRGARRALPWVVLVLLGSFIVLLLLPLSCAVAPGEDCSVLATCASGADAGADGGADARGRASDAAAEERDVLNEAGDAGDALAEASDASDANVAPPCPWGYQCVPRPPSGWLHVALWQAEGDVAAPACPAGYNRPLDGYRGLTAPAAACIPSCTATGQQCLTSVSIYNDSRCVAPCIVDAAVPPSACSVLTGCSGNQGSLEAYAAAPSGGSCEPGVQTYIPPIAWSASARTCITLLPRESACGDDTPFCIATPAPPFASQPCIFLVVPAGQAVPTSCPSPYTGGPPDVYYASATDTRGCTSVNCADAGPAGGSCDGTMSVTGAIGNDCTTGAFSYLIGSGCSAPFALSGPVSHITANYTMTPGSCAVASGGTPTGAAQPSGPAQVVCCM